MEDSNIAGRKPSHRAAVPSCLTTCLKIVYMELLGGWVVEMVAEVALEKEQGYFHSPWAGGVSRGLLLPHKLQRVWWERFRRAEY